MSSTTSHRTPYSAKYRSLGLVGQGQFGQVYCAIHRKAGRLVALKNLNRDRFATHQFLRELRFLLSLEHPNIANCRALEQSESGRQLVLDYCEGGTLRDILEQGTRLSLAEILTLITEVLAALEHAHAKGIIHCDIKPENILLRLSATGWQAKVSDFGIARLNQELQNVSSGATGSPAYMAPERFYFQYSASSDIYSVGVVFYELLMGDRPFSGNYQQLMVSHLNHVVKLPETLPQTLREILKKSMEKLSARRFRSATEMKMAISTMRKSFVAAELRQRFPIDPMAIPSSGFRSKTAFPVPGACTELAILASDGQAPRLLAACGQQVYSWSVNTMGALDGSSPEVWELDEVVERIVPTRQDVIASTAQRVFQLVRPSGTHLLAELTEKVTIARGSTRWVIAKQQATQPRFWLIDAAQTVLKTPRELPLNLPSGEIHCLALDERHHVIATTEKASTHLQVLTRWGRLLGAFTLDTPLCSLVNCSKPAHFLAQAGYHRQDLLVIRLQPYRVMRCRLDITADWLGELVTGYVAISSIGQMVLINWQGQMIGRVDNLPTPSAIAFQPPYHVWLASRSDGNHQVHAVDIRDLNLDIIF